MSLRHFAAGALVGAACASAAWWYGGGSDDVAEAPVAARPEASPRAPSRWAPRPTRSDPTPDRHVDGELAVAYEAIRELERELYGEPVAWDHTIPAAHRPDFVTETIERAMRDCDVPARLVDVDCAEPPCYAVLETEGPPGMFGESGSWYQDLVGCPDWSEPWGNAARVVTDRVTCPDGSTRSFAMISPWMVPADPDAPSTPEAEREVKENLSRRMDARAANAKPRLCF